MSGYWRGKPQGKVARRVRDLRIPSCGFDLRTPPDLSHNEGARLAADGLLCRGLDGYRAVLEAEGEVDFLSEREKEYFMQNGKDGHLETEPDAAEGEGSELEFRSSSSSSESSTARPPESDSDSDTEAADSKEGENGSSESGGSSVEAYFNTEKRAAGLKDAVREFIRTAKKSLSIVTDSFSDVELLCDVLEASKKRFVSVHLLLDRLNLDVFTDVWQELGLRGKDFPKFSVHSVEGETFCSTTGRKLNGQISETFIISDETEALTGSFSFSWLSWLVHRNLAFLVKGSAVSHFLQELERLCTCSEPVPGFKHSPFTLDAKTKPNADRPKPKVASEQPDKSRIQDWIEDGLKSCEKERKERIQTNFGIPRALRQPVMQHACMEKFTKPALGGVDKGAQRKPQYPNLVQYGHQKKNFSQDHREDFWNARQTRIFMTPPGIAAGINKFREERNVSKVKPNATNSKLHGFMSQENGEKKCTQGLNAAAKTNGRSHHFLQSPTMRSPPSSLAAQTKPEANFSPATGNAAGTETVKLRSRLAWITQNSTTRAGHARRPVSFYDANKQAAKTGHAKRPVSFYETVQTNGNTTRAGQMRPVSFYDTVQTKGQWPFHNNASAKPLARSKSLTERPGAAQ